MTIVNEMSHHAMKPEIKPGAPIVWLPGTEPNPEALWRMELHFRKPTYAMGQAWFMGGREMYDELLTTDIDTIPISKLYWYIESICGISSFGPLEEWIDWFHYFLRKLLLPARFEEPGLTDEIPHLITAFMMIYPEAIDEPYRGFRADAIELLGGAIMHPVFWENGSVRDEHLFGAFPTEAWGDSGWSEISGIFASSAFFMWKYLARSQIEPWLRSVFAIDDGPWLAQLILWLLAVRAVLDGEINLGRDLDSFSPATSWETHRLRGDYGFEYPIFTLTPLISDENKAAFRASLAVLLNLKLVENWIDSIAQFPLIESNLCWLPDRFFTEYAEYLT